MATNSDHDGDDLSYLYARVAAQRSPDRVLTEAVASVKRMLLVMRDQYNVNIDEDRALERARNIVQLFTELIELGLEIKGDAWVHELFSAEAVR